MESCQAHWRGTQSFAGMREVGPSHRKTTARCAKESSPCSIILRYTFCRLYFGLLSNKGDAKALQTLMADDFALSSVSGKYFDASKQSMITRWTEPPSPGTSSSSRLIKVFRAYQSAGFGFVAGEI